MWNPNVYQSPGVYWEEMPSASLSPNLPLSPLTIIGEVPANISVTEDIAISCTATELIYTVVDETSIVLTDASGNTTYDEDDDYAILAADATHNTRLEIWADPPTGPSPTGSLNATATCSGGSLANDTYTYVVEAVSANGMETTGVTVYNTDNVTLACSASIGRVDLEWNAVLGAASYRIYRGSSTSVPTLLASVTAPTTTYADIGAVSPNGITVVPQYHNCKVTYNYVQEDRFEVQLWTDVEDIENFYGDAVDSNGVISCKLSFGCKKAAYNGCHYLQTIGVPVGSALSTWINALELLRGEENVGVIVPLYYNTTFFNYCANFISSMQASGKFPFFVLGGTTSENMEDMRLSIPGDGNEDIVIVAYPSVEHFNDVTNTTYDINGYYAAAAIAGKMLSQQVYVPMTRKTIAGVYTVPKISPQQMDYYTTEGLFMLFNRQGQVTVRHGVTTDTTNSATKEISVVRAKHYMLTLLMNDLNNVIVGTALDEFTIVSAKSVTTSRLESLISARVINAYSELKARLNTEEPTRIDIKFKYRPSWPINWVVIQFSIDMTTGEVQTTA